MRFSGKVMRMRRERARRRLKRVEVVVDVLEAEGEE
jgi:hypothetical protein